MTLRRILLLCLTAGLGLTLVSCRARKAKGGDTPVPSDARSAVSQTAEEANPFARLAGNWCVDGDSGAAHLEISEDGRFAAYYASGALEAGGYILHEKDGGMAQTDYSYRFYTDDGELYFEFMDQETAPVDSFETEGEYGQVFFRIAD